MNKNIETFCGKITVIIAGFICFSFIGTYAFSESPSRNKENKLHENVLLENTLEKYQYRFVMGIGYGFLYWLYSITGDFDGEGNIMSKQTSSYNGIILANKAVIWRPWGGLIGFSLYFPLGVSDGIQVLSSENTVQTQLSAKYLARENFAARSLQNVVVKLELGANYQILQKGITINIGGGLALLSLSRTLNMKNITVSSVGVFIDSDLELQMNRFITLVFGVQGGAFFLPIYGGNIVVSPSNNVRNFLMKTLVMFDFAATFSVAFYF